MKGGKGISFFVHILFFTLIFLFSGICFCFAGTCQLYATQDHCKEQCRTCTGCPWPYRLFFVGFFQKIICGTHKPYDSIGGKFCRFKGNDISGDLAVQKFNFSLVCDVDDHAAFVIAKVNHGKLHFQDVLWFPGISV